MRRPLLLAPLLALLGCPQTPWCDRLNPDQPDAARTCVFADEVSGPRPFSREDGYPVDFVARLPDQRPDQTELADGTRLTGQPWGLDWSVPAGDPSAESVAERVRRTTVRRDSVGPVVTVEVAPDESRYLLGLADGRFLVRSADHAPLLDGRAVEHVDTSLGIEVLNTVRQAAFSADGSVLATADGILNLDVWAPSDGGHRWHAATPGPVRDVAVSPDGRRVATGTSDGTLTVWDAATGDVLATWAHPRAVADVAFTADGRHIVAYLPGEYRRGQAARVDPVDRRVEGGTEGVTTPAVVAVWRLP